MDILPGFRLVLEEHIVWKKFSKIVILLEENVLHWFVYTHFVPNEAFTDWERWSVF